MRFTSAPRDRRQVLSTPASTPEDILAYMAHSLGYWPDGSLVIATAAAGRLGPCLRLDLPAGPASAVAWAAGLPAILSSLSPGAPGRRVTAFFAAFAGSEGEDAGADLPRDRAGEPGAARASADGLTLRSAPPDPERSSRQPPATTVERAALGLACAAGVALEAGLDPAELWIVDRHRDRWGWLQAPPQGEAPGASVRSGGTIETILASPIGAAMTAEGHVLRGRVEAVSDDPRLTGPYRVSSMLGEAEAARLLAGIRTEVAAGAGSGSEPGRADGTPRFGGVAEALSCLEEVMTVLDGRTSGLDEPTPLGLVDGLVPKELARIARLVQDDVGLSAALLCAVRGPTAAARHAEAVSGGRAQGAGAEGPGALILRGRSEERPPSDSRWAALRLVLTVLGEALGDPAESLTAVGNAYISWFAGLSSQAQLYLRRVGHPRAEPARALLRLRMAEQPLPRWLTRPEQP